MKYDVVFSLEAVEELVGIIGGLSDDFAAVIALEKIRKQLELNPRESGAELSEGLFYIDSEPIRAFFAVYDDLMIVEVSDFRQI